MPELDSVFIAEFWISGHAWKRVVCPTKQTLEKVYFYQDRVKKRIAKKKKKKNIKKAQIFLFSVIAVSQYLCYTTYCYHKISQQAYY